MKFRTPLLAGCALMALAGTSPALAQTTQPAADEINRVGEVTVTAERRAQNLQDVPVAISAYDTETRENAGILTIQDMAQFTPGLSYNTSTDRPSIRGIGRQSNTFSLDSPVANYFDGIYTSSVQDASRRPMFIERTEILRGPQGALSGRGSIAGAINTISKRPEDTFGGEIGLQGGNYQRYGVEGTITGPLTSWLRGRINYGRYAQDKGFFTNVANDSTEGDQPNNRQIQDYMLDGDIGENIDFFLKAAFADYDETRRSSGSFAPYIAGSNPCTPNAFGGGLVPSAAYGYFQPGPAGGCAGNTGAFNNQAVILGDQRTNPVTPGNLRVFNNDYRSRQKLDDHHNYTGEVIWHAPAMDVRYIGGHQNYLYTQLTDADDTAVQSYIVPGTARRITPGGVNMYQEEREWFSHEFNITSTTEGPIQWVAGLYQSFEDFNQQPQTTFYAGYPEFNAPALANQAPSRVQYGQLFGQTRSSAVFGQLDYAPNETWKITGGLRYNVDEKKVHEQTRLLYNNLPSLAGLAAIDITTSQAPGYALVNPATAVIPAGYTLLDPTQFPLNGAGTGRVLPDGTVAPLTGANTPLLAPGVVSFPTVNPTTFNRERDLKNDWNALTGSLGVDYTLDADNMFYARYARGYRPGGFNAGFVTLTPQVGSEFVNSYEVGSKLTLNGELRLNTAVYLYDYTDIQLNLATYERCITPGDFSTCTAINSFVNLPSAKNSGLEVEALWMPTDNWQFIASYGYLNAKIDDGRTTVGFENPSDPAAILPGAQRLLPITQCNINPGLPVGSVCVVGTTGTLGPAFDSATGQQRYTQDLSGNPITNSPKHKVAINANYTVRDLLSRGDLTLSASYIWRDKALSNLFNQQNDYTPSYSQVNLRAVFRQKDDKFQIIAYVQNVLDEDIFESGGVSRRAAGVPGAGQVYYNTFDLAPPRTFGIEVQHRF